MRITEKDIDIGLRIANTEDTELRALFDEELMQKAAPLRSRVSMLAQASAIVAYPDDEDKLEREQAKYDVFNAFMFFAGSVWASLDFHFPSVRLEEVRASRNSSQPRWVIIQAIGMYSPISFIYEFQKMISGHKYERLSYKLLVLCDLVLNAALKEENFSLASGQDIVKEAERLLSQST